MEVLAYAAWEVWKGRIKVCFENKTFFVHDVLNRSYAMWREYSTAVEKDAPIITRSRRHAR